MEGHELNATANALADLLTETTGYENATVAESMGEDWPEIYVTIAGLDVCLLVSHLG